MRKTDVIEDLEIAKSIIKEKDKSLCDKEAFYDRSAVFRFSNEDIIGYKKYLYEKKKALIITSSSDAILSSILFGTKSIDSVDISRFPQYYYELKLATIKALSLKEYVSFLVPEINLRSLTQEACNSKTFDLFYYVKQFLTGDNRFFWDELFNQFGPLDIFQSNLFKRENNKALRAIMTGNYFNAPYLKDEETYKLLREKISECIVHHYVGDIFELSQVLTAQYDLVNLSNIIDYYDAFKYKSLLNSFNISENGIILSYIFTVDDGLDTVFNEENYTFQNLFDENIMIYKKQNH